MYTESIRLSQGLGLPSGGSRRMKLFLICALGVMALGALPARASTVSFSSPLNTFYVGTEDSPSSGCDCDYNDLIFSVASSAGSGIALVALYGSGDLQTSAPSLHTSSSVTAPTKRRSGITCRTTPPTPTSANACMTRRLIIPARQLASPIRRSTPQRSI
jgi:hypothetical protein